MDKVIVFPNETGIAIFIPSENINVENVVHSVVPEGLPFLFVNKSDIPQDIEFRNAWDADFSQPDGISTGANTASVIQDERMIP